MVIVAVAIIANTIIGILPHKNLDNSEPLVVVNCILFQGKQNFWQISPVDCCAG